MAGRVIQPPEIVKLEGQTIFLAGPIQGALDWQSQAIAIISKLSSPTNIANPRRQYLDGQFDYAKQVDWETHYLRQAAENGVILFWLAREQIHDHDRAYAQTSRFELAEWKIRHERDGINLAIGIESGFSGARYITKRLNQDCPDIIIQDSLEKTCREALELLT
ncbi:MAG TPA: nucleoside 2-deoxyribosyltransferase domain-containing protein [Candidatus Saccharimonadales bacterium]|nr:nucleoside 2-deoxyribosyltransferase domain-containing protein [Candidatus Saccharimonadales bacterium]